MRPLIALFALLLLTGCPPDLERPPAFVTVTGFDLTTGQGQGAATADIREVWVFVDRAFQGAYRLPARIPLDFSGSTEVTFRAGIRQNGISTTPDFYDFYAPVERQLDLVPGDVVDVGTLPLRYRDDAQFALIEDFEPESNRSFVNPVISDRAIESQSEVVRSGQASGRLRLDADAPLVEIASTQALSGLTDERPYVYLEIDVRGDVFGQWGVTGVRNGDLVRNFDPGFNPRDSWTKIYYDITPIVVASDTEPLVLLLSTILPEGVTEGALFIDNIKVLHF